MFTSCFSIFRSTRFSSKFTFSPPPSPTSRVHPHHPLQLRKYAQHLRSDAPVLHVLHVTPECLGEPDLRRVAVLYEAGRDAVRPVDAQRTEELAPVGRAADEGVAECGAVADVSLWLVDTRKEGALQRHHPDEGGVWDQSLEVRWFGHFRDEGVVLGRGLDHPLRLVVCQPGMVFARRTERRLTRMT